MGRPLAGFNRPGSRVTDLGAISRWFVPEERTALLYRGMGFLTVMISISHEGVFLRDTIPLPSIDFDHLFE